MINWRVILQYSHEDPQRLAPMFQLSSPLFISNQLKYIYSSNRPRNSHVREFPGDILNNAQLIVH